MFMKLSKEFNGESCKRCNYKYSSWMSMWMSHPHAANKSLLRCFEEPKDSLVCTAVNQLINTTVIYDDTSKINYYRLFSYNDILWKWI